MEQTQWICPLHREQEIAHALPMLPIVDVVRVLCSSIIANRDLMSGIVAGYEDPAPWINTVGYMYMGRKVLVFIVVILVVLSSVHLCT